MTTFKPKTIDSGYYDKSDYHNRNAAHLLNPESSFQQYRVQKILEIYNPGTEETILDLGCGWGTLCWSLADRVKHITGLDFSEKSICLCNEGLEKKSYPNLSFHHGNAIDTKLPPKSFDLVIAADLFEHLYPDDSEKVVRETYRLLRRGGHFSIWTPNRGHIIEILKARNIFFKKDETHVDYKSLQRMLTMLERSGFTVEKHHYVESHIPLFKHIERIFLKFFPPFRRRIAILARKP